MRWGRKGHEYSGISQTHPQKNLKTTLQYIIVVLSLILHRGIAQGHCCECWFLFWEARAGPGWGEARTGRQIHVLHLCSSHSRLYTVFASVTAHGRRTLQGNTAGAQNRKISAQY